MEIFWDCIEENKSIELGNFVLKNAIDKNIKDMFGLSAIHFALSKGSVDSAKILIDNSFSLDLRDLKGQTPLHYCAFYNYLAIAILLLEGGASLNIEDEYGNQPLWTAVFNDKGFGSRIEIIKLFIEHGADKDHLNKYGLSPRAFALNAGYKEVEELL